jgi:hypothetical protein
LAAFKRPLQDVFPKRNDVLPIFTLLFRITAPAKPFDSGPSRNRSSSRSTNSLVFVSRREHPCSLSSQIFHFKPSGLIAGQPESPGLLDKWKRLMQRKWDARRRLAAGGDRGILNL